jgi:hypothetical protein
MIAPFARIAWLLVAILVVSAAPAAAGEAGGTSEIRAPIERQFNALARDDAAGAYASAAPGIKAIFTDPQTFIGMVRSKYAPVYRHRSAEFGDMRREGDTASQVVTLVDDDNQVWTALYDLARQPDGGWLITRCVLIRSTDAST